MHFIDSTEVFVKSGDGGNGMVSFKTASNKPKLGADGGDGGPGGNVVFVGFGQLNTLSHVRYKHRFIAENGVRGGSNGKTGAHGADAEIVVPLGTEVYNAKTGEKICDILGDGERFVVAKGGQRGLGNLRFLSSTHQAPVEFTEGKPGVEIDLRLELKLLADVGLAGLPNAGKSTLLSVLSSAKPKIADYPFTTLVPNLGVVELRERGEFNLQSFVMADVPGLIEGASEGRGLGHSFLRHLERTKVIAYVIDALPIDGEKPEATLELLRRELENYDTKLSSRTAVVILNKIDIAMDEADQALIQSSKELIESAGYRVFLVSAMNREGLVDLKEQLFDLVQEEKKIWNEMMATKIPQHRGLLPAELAGIDFSGLKNFSESFKLPQIHAVQ
ncbi:MAG: GTPase ObgE [Proteobacteria bacterium]|nr:GTPase ObgE [Pseudomonadota bacterium]